MASDPDCISAQDMTCLVNFASEHNCAAPPSVAQLQELREVLVKATKLASTGEATELVTLCRQLPPAIQRTITMNDDHIEVALSWKTSYEAYVFEVLCALIDFSVAAFSTRVGELVTRQAISLGPSIPKILEALSIALNSQMRFYQIRQRSSRGMREITVGSSRLASVLQVPGFFVRVAGAVNGQVHYFCTNKGVNETGEACDCCTPPAWADAILVSLSWLLAKTAHGSGFEYMLKMLEFPSHHTLPTIVHLLRPLALSLWCSNDCKLVVGHMEDNFKAGFFKDVYKTVCCRLFHYLDEMVPTRYVKPCPSFDAVIENDKAFSDVLKHLHSITCWVVAYYGDDSELVVSLRDSLGKLQERMWEQLLEARRYATACTSIGAAIEATPSPASGNSFFSWRWLEEKKIILKLLKNQLLITTVPKVEQFVRILAKNEAVVQENDFLVIMERSPDDSARDLIVAAMLDELDISAYSAEFLECALKWLETCQAESVTNGSRIFFVLSKLFPNDKHRRCVQRFLTLLRKHATCVSHSNLVDCLNMVADHYASHHVIRPPDDLYMQTSDGKARLLEACSSADMATCTSTDVGDALNHTHVYGQKAKAWKNEEIALYVTTSSTLAEALAFDFPFTRHETAKKCLDRLDLAQHLSVDLNPEDSNTLTSVMTTAMAPELQTLETLKEESSLHCCVAEEVKELGERHVQEYDALMQEQGERLVKFLLACRKEKDDVIWNALYEKAKVLAVVKRASISRAEDFSSEEILKRMLRKAGGALKEVEGKHKESVLDNECSICCSEFSSKQKRACLEPCGHCSACVDCTTQEWKRTKTCPLCKASIQEPMALPVKLFF